MKPHVHAQSSAEEFGGKPEDYLEIHRFMDSSKGVISDHRHRALTHNSWFIMNVLPRVFGYSIKNSDGKEVSVQDIGEQHVREDYRGRFIPSAQDFLERMEYADWMKNGASGLPSSVFPDEITTPVQLAPKSLESHPTYDGSKRPIQPPSIAIPGLDPLSTRLVD